jgi:hypothetical protein
MKGIRLRRGLKFAAFALLAITVLTFVVMNLWNWLMPALFARPLISFWQALGLLVLSKILFSGFRGRPGYRRQWRNRMRERWEGMTPEERERFKNGLRGKADCWREANP